MSETSREPGKRTFVAHSGRLVKDIYESDVATRADLLGLSCEITEHPHLLTTEIAFTVSGEEDALDEFERQAIHEAGLTLRRVSGFAS